MQEQHQCGRVGGCLANWLEEHHLKVGGHGEDFVHAVVGRVAEGGELEQGEQAIEVGVVPEAKRGSVAIARDDVVGIVLNVTPQGAGSTSRDAVALRQSAVADGHALVVGLIDRQHLVGREEVEEVNGELDVLHVGGDGEELGEQADFTQPPPSEEW